jgi:hypothetical protein
MEQRQGLGQDVQRRPPRCSGQPLPAARCPLLLACLSCGWMHFVRCGLQGGQIKATMFKEVAERLFSVFEENKVYMISKGTLKVPT